MKNPTVKTKKPLFENSTFLKILSVCIACVCWLVVAMMNITDYTRVISDIPVNVALQADALARLELNIIELSHEFVSVEVQGPRGIVGNLEPDDLITTLQIPADLVEPNVYDLRLVLVSPAEDFRVVSYSPRQVRVRIDQLEHKTFDIVPEISGVSTLPGHILEEASVSPKQITVTGPGEEIERIAGVAVQFHQSQMLERTFATELPVILLDAQGQEIDPGSRHLTLGHSNVQLLIPVLREKELPLEIRFVASGMPDFFPIADLQYTMSNYEIMAAGPVDTITRFSEIVLGFIDLRTLTTENHTFTFDVEMPAASVINLDNIFTVTVHFPAGNWDEALFNVADVEILNKPARYEVSLLTRNIPNVRMVGEQGIIGGMTAEDIVAQIDLSERTLTPGQYSIPVKISAPTKGLVWAVGEYSVVVQVSE